MSQILNLVLNQESLLVYSLAAEQAQGRIQDGGGGGQSPLKPKDLIL